jgi:hypothetical protein
MPKPNSNVSANEGIKPPDSPERRKFLAESEAQRKQEAAAAAQRAADVEARGKAKAAQRSKDEEMMKKQADMDRKMQNAYTRATGIKLAKGGSVSSASKRADGCAMKGKTRGKFV